MLKYTSKSALNGVTKETKNNTTSVPARTPIAKRTDSAVNKDVKDDI